MCGDHAPTALETQDSRCAAKGQLQPARVVDHIVPVHGADDKRFWLTSNHQALCEQCHNAKRQREAGAS